MVIQLSLDSIKGGVCIMCYHGSVDTGGKIIHWLEKIKKTEWLLKICGYFFFVFANQFYICCKTPGSKQKRTIPKNYKLAELLIL
jgi:hypothetical protein